MFFNKEKRKNKFVKAKTPESRMKQKAAIAAYYKKRLETTYSENKKI